MAFLPPASKGWGKVIFSVCVSVHTSMGGGGTYLGWREGYLPWMGEGVPTLDGEDGVPTLDGGRGYLPWMEGMGYLPWTGRGYLPWMGRGYLPWMGGGGYLPFTGYAAGGMPLAFMQEDFSCSTHHQLDECAYFPSRTFRSSTNFRRGNDNQMGNKSTGRKKISTLRKKSLILTSYFWQWADRSFSAEISSF